ncbi:MAG: general secretion pathway protein GspK [Desulfobacterales bacterium]|nr:general secretion pathway protein GspK [Desulfobacterales bacterium]
MSPGMLKNNRGIAVLITLTIITILVTVALELNRKMRTAVVSTAAGRDRVSLSSMASSGIHAAMAMLVRDKLNSNTDSVQEDWANPEKIDELLRAIPFDAGRVTLKIIDELGKVQVNALVKFPEGRDFNEPQRVLWERFARFFLLLHESGDIVDPIAIIDSLKDWLDFGDDDAITGLSGAESSYYQDLDPPYAIRNGPITHLGELLKVKGITPDLFQDVQGVSGVSRYLTIYGMNVIIGNSFTYDGRININTAELPVLASIMPDGHEGFAQLIYQYREEKSDAKFVHDLQNPLWYKNVPGMTDITIDPRLILTTSDIFRIEAVAELSDRQMTVSAVVQREKAKETNAWRCNILSWEIK